MSFQFSDLYFLLPELFLLVGVSIVLVLDLFVSHSRKDITYYLALLVLFISAVLPFLCVPNTPTVLVSGLIVVDYLGAVLKTFICLLLIGGLFYAKAYLKDRALHHGEYYCLTLFAALGMMVMVSSNHFISLYLGLELLSLSLYAMVALQRDSVMSSEAAIKYFILGAIASGMLLYGMSMVYGATGGLEIGSVVETIAQGKTDTNLLRIGLVFIVVGIGFKLGVVPFHMWVPDVYQGAPTSVTTLIGTAPKVAAFGFVVRLLAEALGHVALHQEWSQMLILLAVASLSIGNIVAIVQTNFKRLLAYSTIAQMGFLLLGFMTGDLVGYSASLFYILVYSVMALGGFGAILLLSKKGFECADLEDLSGLSQTNPWVAFLLLIVLFSMAGIPPTVGFWSKLYVIQSVVEAGHVGLAIFAVLSSLIGAYYYLKVVKVMFFDPPKVGHSVTKNYALSVYSVNGLLLLGLGLAPGWCLSFCKKLIDASVRFLG